MTLTTPAMASEPYAADAPPVTTSMRSTSIEGISVRSTALPSEFGTTRRVSTSVNVRVPKNGFRPRRFASCAPTLKLPTPTLVSEKNGVFCGIVRAMSPTLTSPRFSICSRIDRGHGLRRIEAAARDARAGDDDLFGPVPGHSRAAGRPSRRPRPRPEYRRNRKRVLVRSRLILVAMAVSPLPRLRESSCVTDGKPFAVFGKGENCAPRMPQRTAYERTAQAVCSLCIGLRYLDVESSFRWRST